MRELMLTFLCAFGKQDDIDRDCIPTLYYFNKFLEYLRILKVYILIDMGLFI